MHMYTHTHNDSVLFSNITYITIISRTFKTIFSNVILLNICCKTMEAMSKYLINNYVIIMVFLWPFYF